MYKQKYVQYSLNLIMFCEKKTNNKTETAEERPSYTLNDTNGMYM